MSEEQPNTKQLREALSRQEAEEQALANAAAEEQESAIHERRAEKARYLRQKLEERAESEREATRPGGSAGEEASEPEAEE